MNRIEATKAYGILEHMVLTKVKRNEDKYAIIDAMRQLRPIAEDYRVYQRMCLEKLKNEGHEEKVMLLRRWGNVYPDTEEGREVKAFFASYNERIEESMYEYAHEEISISSIGSKAFLELIDSNSELSLGQISIINLLVRNENSNT